MRNNPTSPELLKKYPHLVPRELFPNMSCAALAAKNLRIELKREFPGLKFKVQSENFSGGSSVRAHAEVFRIDGYTDQDLRELNNKLGRLRGQFAYGNFDGMTDSYDYKSDPGIRAFQDAFGSAGYVFADVRFAHASVEAVEMERRAAKKKEQLEKVAAKAAARAAGPTTPKL